MNQTLLLREKNIIEYISDTLNSIKNGDLKIVNSKDIFHHTSSYSNVPLILQHGILPLSELRKKSLIHLLDSEYQSISNDEFHSNGVDGVSFAKVQEKDPYYENQLCFYYDPVMCINQIDIIYSIMDIRNYRKGMACNYYNEYVFNRNFSQDDIKSLDIRLLKYIRNNPNNLQEIVQYFNLLKECAILIKQMNLNISIREMSSEKDHNCEIGLLLDRDRLIDMPKIFVKK